MTTLLVLLLLVGALFAGGLLLKASADAEQRRARAIYEAEHRARVARSAAAARERLRQPERYYRNLERPLGRPTPDDICM